MITRSDHANNRMHERSIPPVMLDWLLTHGRREPSGNGSECVFFDKLGRKALQARLGWSIYAKVEPKLDVYAIISSEGTVITAGHRYRKICRK